MKGTVTDTGSEGREATELQTDTSEPRSSFKEALRRNLNDEGDSKSTPASAGGKASAAAPGASSAGAQDKPRASRQGIAFAKPAEPAGAPAAEPAASTTQSGPSLILPPEDMTPEEKAEFAQLPPAAQRYLSRRAYETRADYSRKTEEVARRAREVGGLHAIAQRERDYYSRLRIPIEQVVENAIAWDKAFAEGNREQAALEYLESQGVDLDALVALRADGGAQPTASAAAGRPQALTREEAQELARQEFERLHSEREQVALAQQNKSAIDEFIASKPIFQDPGTGAQLEREMAPIVGALRAANPSKPLKEILEDAYQRTVRGVPLFSDLISRLDAKAEAERSTAEANRALAAARSISGGPGSGSPKTKYKNFRENLRARLHQ